MCVCVCGPGREERWGEEKAGYLMEIVVSDLALAGTLMLTDVFEKSALNKQDCLDVCEKLLTLKWTNPLLWPVQDGVLRGPPTHCLIRA